MATDYDVCIIGSGAGAGPVAYTLSSQGYKVLILEKGSWFNEDDFTKDEIAVCRRSTFTPNLQNEPQVIEYLNSKNEWIEENNALSGWDFWNGSLVGGSSNLMSGFFHRLKPVDFRLKSEFGASDGANIVDWPIDYSELEPYYTMCEEMVGISGKIINHPFLEPRSTPDYPFPPLAEHALTPYLDKAAKSLGFNPLPLARAILSQPYNNRNACSYSAYCGSYGCTTGAKGSARAALLNAAIKTGNCTIKANSHVTKLVTNKKGKLERVDYIENGSKRSRVDAKIFVVACQAVETSRLLLLSDGPKFPNGLANNSGQVGKNLIFSSGGVGSGVFDSSQFSAEEFSSINDYHLFINRALQDWYVIDSTKTGRIKGGTVDFLMAHANPIRRAVRLKRKNGKLLWGSELKNTLVDEFHNKVKLNFEIFCDWTPTDNCRVELSKNVVDRYGIPVAKIKVGFHERDLIPGKYIAAKGEAVLNRMGAKHVRSNIDDSPPKNLMAGGCRFGSDPENSVLDKDCRAHEVENLFITDGSFMPTGGSVTPTWTIYANSFRVAEKIASQL